MSSRTTKARNTRMENLNLYGTPKKQHKKWKNIAKELSDRHITLCDIADLDSPKQKGLLQVFSSEDMTLGDLTILRQYSEAIVNGSTKAAEFIRDTMGEKPSTQLDVNNIDESGLSQLSLDELVELRELLKKNIKED